MGNYQEARVKLTNTQLNKLKSAAKRQANKIRNAFTNNVSTDTKLSKAQISKRIQSGGSFGTSLANLDKKVITDLTIPSARDNLPWLVNNLASNALNKFERKISEKGAVRWGRGFTFFYFEWRYEWCY